MIARKPDNPVGLYKLPSFLEDGIVCPHCGAYQWPEECGSKKDPYWHCCSNGRVPSNTMMPESLSPAQRAAMPKGPEKTFVPFVVKMYERYIASCGLPL